MNASKLVKERADLLARIGEINESLALLGNPAKPVEIRTRRNLRNTAVGYRDGDEWVEVKVYSDGTLTSEASEYEHGGWIPAEDAARLKDAGQVDDDFLTLYVGQ